MVLLSCVCCWRCVFASVEYDVGVNGGVVDDVGDGVYVVGCSVVYVGSMGGYVVVVVDYVVGSVVVIAVCSGVVGGGVGVYGVVVVVDDVDADDGVGLCCRCSELLCWCWWHCWCY